MRIIYKNKIIKDDLEAIKKYYPKIEEEIFNKLITLDPTYKEGSNSAGNYGKWILNIYNQGRLKDEDFYKVRDELEEFEQKKKYFTNKDINQFKDLPSLAEALENIQVELTENQKEKEFKKIVKEAPLNADIIYEDDDVVVYSPNDYLSSCKLSSNTQWCTGISSHGDDRYYNIYNKQGKLYIIHNKHNLDDKYQFEFKSGQFKNRYDKNINAFDFIKKFPQLKDLFSKNLPKEDLYRLNSFSTPIGLGISTNEEIINIPEGIGKIEQNAFASGKRNKLIKKIIIPSTVTAIDKYVFKDLPLLEEIEVSKNNPKYYSQDGSLYSKRDNHLIFEPFTKRVGKYENGGFTEIKNQEFQNFKKLTSFEIPSSVTRIGDYAFAGSGLKEIKIPGTVKEIGNRAFAGCISLKNIDIENGVELIGASCFYRCISLEKLYIPPSVRVLGNGFIGYCNNLKEISGLEGVKETGYNSFWLDENKDWGEYWTLEKRLKEVEIFGFQNANKNKIKIKTNNQTLINNFNESKDADRNYQIEINDSSINDIIKKDSKIQERILTNNFKQNELNFKNMVNNKKLKFNEWLKKYYNQEPYEIEDKSILKQKHIEYMNYLEPDDHSFYSGYPWLKDCPELVEHSEGVYVLKRGNNMQKNLKIEDENIEGFDIKPNDWDTDVWAFEINKEVTHPEYGDDTICIVLDLSNCADYLDWVDVCGMDPDDCDEELQLDKNAWDKIKISFEGYYSGDSYTRDQVISALEINDVQLDNIIQKCKERAVPWYEEEKQKEVEDQAADWEDFWSYYKDSSIGDIIKKEKDGYVVYSEKGKKLSKPYKTEEEAKKRLQQIEYFKHSKDSNMKVSKKLLEDQIKKVLRDFLVSEEGYNDRDIDDYVVIEAKDFVNDYGDKGIKVEIRNDLIGYYELPDEVVDKLNKVVSNYDEDSYFEPWDAYTWEAIIWDKQITDAASAPYYYLFPADLSKKDLDVLPKYHLKFVGEMSEDSEDKGSKVVKGSKMDLEKYAEEYLAGYSLAEEYLYPETDLDIELVKDTECKDTVIKNNDVYETLDKYLKWEGIHGYTQDIMDAWESKMSYIDGGWKMFDTPEKAVSALLEWEGIIGYDSTIIDILKGGDAFINTGKNGEIDATDNKGYRKETDFWHDSLYEGIEINKTADGTYTYTLDDNVYEAKTLEEVRKAIDDYLYPDKDKTVFEKKEYVVYDPETANKIQRKAMFWGRGTGGRYMREEDAETFTKEEAEKIESYKGKHKWVKKVKGAPFVDSKVKDEKVRTQKGEYDLVNMTEQELREQGYDLNHVDGDTKVFAKNNRFVAIKAQDHKLTIDEDASVEDIDKLIADEEETIKAYEEAMKTASEAHKSLYAHIIEEELEHISELKNLKEAKLGKIKDSTDLMDLLNKCKDILKQSKADKDFTIAHKKEGEQDKLILQGSLDFEDTEMEEELIEKITDCVEEFYPNTEFKYSDRTAGGIWLLKE